MDSGLSTSGSVSYRGGRRRQIVYWVLLHGDRRSITGIIVVGVIALVAAFTTLGIFDVGPDGMAASMFASGFTSGIMTLMTIALSINQLILTRVFGSPQALMKRLEGTREMRREIEVLATEPSSPNDPADFLSMLATTIRDRATDLRAAIVSSDWDHPDEVIEVVRDIEDYGEDIDQRLAGKTDVVEVLEVVIGTEYARNMTAVHHLQNKYEDSLSKDVTAELQAVNDLLESIAVTRQFFKTLTLQQDFAHLSRLVVYYGLTALVVTISIALVYRTNAVTVPASVLPLVVSLGIGIVVSPLAVFVAYIVRSATIAYRTASVGPFIPPEHR